MTAFWIILAWIACGGMSMLMTMDLQADNRWSKPLLFAMGPLGFFIVMVAASRY